MGIKSLFRKVIGKKNQGRLDYFCDTSLKTAWGGPFNGQRFRQCIFFDLLYQFPIQAIVETGTYSGTTTALFAATRLPVYTVEANPRIAAYAKVRFLFNRENVHIHDGDSRTFLRELNANGTFSKDNVFFYLDAHWKDDLPLKEELEIIFSNWNDPIVMIDDFQVPDSDYSYDDYGPGKILDLDYLEPVISSFNLSAFFPAVDSSDETGAKRGSIVLCTSNIEAELNTKIKTLTKSVHT